MRSAAPIHYEGRRLDVAATTALVAEARASIARVASAAFDELAAALAAPIVSISLRAWPADFPDDIAIQRRAPYEARADAVMYRQEACRGSAHARGWEVHLYEAGAVAGQGARAAGGAGRGRLSAAASGGRLGPPWTKDHRVAFAAAIVAG